MKEKILFFDNFVGTRESLTTKTFQFGKLYDYHSTVTVRRPLIQLNLGLTWEKFVSYVQNIRLISILTFKLIFLILPATVTCTMSLLQF